MEFFDQRGGELKGWFAPCDYYVAGGVSGNGGNNALFRHFLVRLVLRVAERALEVATGEADKHGGYAGEEPFTLEGVEYFVYSHHRLEVYVFKPWLDVGGYIAFGLLKSDLITVWHLIANPAREIFGRRIEVEEFVEKLMVQAAFNVFLDVAKIGHHTVLVELFGTAIDCSYSVVAVNALTLALVGQSELVCEGYFYSFGYVVHGCISP